VGRGCPCPVAGRSLPSAGAARAPSPDVRYAHPGLRSLGGGCASASCLRWPPTPAPGARAAPRGFLMMSRRTSGWRAGCAAPVKTGGFP